MRHNVDLIIVLAHLVTYVSISGAATEELTPMDVTLQSLRQQIREVEHGIESFSPEDNPNRLDEIEKVINAVEIDSAATHMLMPTLRNIKLQLWLRVFALLDRHKDLNFSEKDMPEVNIAPPSSPGVVYDSGVAAESIKDPETKAKYAEMKRKNDVKAKNYRLQMKIRSLEKSWQQHILKYILAHFRGKDEILEADRMITLFVEDQTKRDALKRGLLLGEN